MGLNLSCCLPQSSEQVSLQLREKISRNRWRGIWSSLLFSRGKNSLSHSGRPRLPCRLFCGLFRELRGRTTWHWVNEPSSDEEVWPHCQNARTCWVMGRSKGDWQTSSSQWYSFQERKSCSFSLATHYKEESGGEKDGSSRKLILSLIWATQAFPCKSRQRVCPSMRAHSMPAASSKLSLILQPRVLSLALLPTTTTPTDHTSIALVLSTGHFAKVALVKWLHDLFKEAGPDLPPQLN